MGDICDGPRIGSTIPSPESIRMQIVQAVVESSRTRHEKHTQRRRMQGNERVSIGREPGVRIGHTTATHKIKFMNEIHGGTQNKPQQSDGKPLNGHNTANSVPGAGAGATVENSQPQTATRRFVRKRWAKEALHDSRNRHKQDGNKATNWSASNGGRTTPLEKKGTVRTPAPDKSHQIKRAQTGLRVGVTLT